MSSAASFAAGRRRRQRCNSSCCFAPRPGPLAHRRHLFLHPTNAALKDFRRLLRRPQAAARLLSAYLAASPGWQELHALWDAQPAAKAPAAALELLQLLHDLLRFEPPAEAEAAMEDDGGGEEQDGDDEGEGGAAAAAARAAATIRAAQDALARSLLQRRLKALYFNLSSDARARVNATLLLLAAAAARGGQVARELVAAFDWTLSALPRLARPPRAATAAAAAGGADGSGGAAAATAHWATWGAASIGARPSRALFVEFGEHCFKVEEWEGG